MNNDELQKAIDDITKNAAAASPLNNADAPAPVADPAAAATVVDIPPAPMGMPELGELPEIPEIPMPAAPMAAPVAEAPQSPEIPVDPEMPAEPVAAMPEAPVAPVAPEIPAAPADGELDQIKADALKELFPLMDKIDVNPVQKFRIYRDMAKMNHDKNVVSAAHDVIREIPDESTKAKALVDLIEMIDEM